MVDQITIKPETVKELRERTGAGFMDCKRALEETGGDIEQAVVLLRERGQAAAAKKAGREAREGLDRQLHPRRRPARRAHRGQLRDRLRGAQRGLPEARARPRDAGRRPGARVHDHRVRPGRRRRAQEGRAAGRRVGRSPKPEAIRDKIVEGQLRKWYQQVVLYEQPFRDTDQTVGQLITDAIATHRREHPACVASPATSSGRSCDATARSTTEPLASTGARRPLPAASCSSCRVRRCSAPHRTASTPRSARSSRGQVRDVQASGVRGRHRGRWRQHLPGPRGRGTGHGARDRRLHRACSRRS